MPQEAVARAVVGGDVAAGDEVVEAVLGLGLAAEEGVRRFGCFGVRRRIFD